MPKWLPLSRIIVASCLLVSFALLAVCTLLSRGWEAAGGNSPGCKEEMQVDITKLTEKLKYKVNVLEV